MRKLVSAMIFIGANHILFLSVKILMLIFVGLGIRGEESLTLEGLKELKEADEVYAEFYTSPLPKLDFAHLQELAGKKIQVLRREDLEDGEEILRKASVKRVVLLVPGDPMVATTHVSLRLRAAERGICTKVVHSSSIVSAVVGLTGLQSYKFGKSATVPLGQKSVHPYEVVGENLKRGLHTLLLLDVKAEEGVFMSAREALTYLLQLEKELQRGYLTEERLAVVVARAGSDDCLVRGNTVGELVKMDFGPPPHALVIPGRLHFVEEEALRVFAQVPDFVIERHRSLRLSSLEENLTNEIEKWTQKLEEKIEPLKGMKELENVYAYLLDSKFFRGKGDLIKSFECVIWAWALFKQLKGES
jgi:diphthine synthase